MEPLVEKDLLIFILEAISRDYKKSISPRKRTTKS